MNPDNCSVSFRSVWVTKLLLLTAMCFASLVLPENSYGFQKGEEIADLNVAKSGDKAAPRGGNITYSVVVGNAGPDSAASVVLEDPIPAHTTFVSAAVSQGSVMFDGVSVVASFGTIAAIESASLTVVVSVNNDTPRDTIISNTAMVRSNTVDPDPSNNSGTAFTAVTGTFSGDLLISEFRFSGPGVIGGNTKGLSNSAEDEFIEIYNNTTFDHTVSAVSGTGYGIVASDGVLRCTIPNGTIIPKNGHFLCINSNGYSLSGYPAGNGTTATGDASYSTDIPDNSGIALFNNNSGDYTTDTRLDAVGSTSEANPLYKEGSGYPALGPVTLGKQGAIEYSFYRDNCGRQGVVSSQQPCTITTGVIDTDNNATDFIFVDTFGTPTNAGQRLGAPGPENLSSPVENNTSYTVTLLDPCVGGSSAPNQLRDQTPDPQSNSTFGTIALRRTITNNSIRAATRLRFRVTQQTSLPAPVGTADLRLRTSPDALITVNQQPCGSGNFMATVNGTTLEQPPGQPFGGSFNSTVFAPAVGPGVPKGARIPKGPVGVPLNPESSINVQFLWGVQQTGRFRVTLNVEVLEPLPPEEGPVRVKGRQTKEQ